MKIESPGLLARLAKVQPSLFRNGKLEELLRIYEDLEKLITHLGHQTGADRKYNPGGIDLVKLVRQLQASKRRLERRISNTFLLEKQEWRRKIQRGLSLLSQNYPPRRES
jgi:hypothetical protein